MPPAKPVDESDTLYRCPAVTNELSEKRAGRVRRSKWMTLSIVGAFLP